MPPAKNPVPCLPAQAAAQAAAKLEQAIGLHQQGHLQQAEVQYKEILQSQPEHFDALQLLATIDVQRKNFVAAVALFDRALAINPDHADAYYNRGIALAALKLPAQALHSYDCALQLKPGHAGAHINRGNALLELKRPLDALQSYDNGLLIEPASVEACNNRGTALHELQLPAQALASFDQALQLKPDHVNAHVNRGNALRELKRHGQALESYQRALELQPDDVDAYFNRGIALSELQRHADALDSYGQAQQRQSDHASAHWNESLCRLLMGEFAAGWQKYEWRWKTGNGLKEFRRFAQPLWLGKQDLKGKIILLHAEQGLGDTIQFCRYASQVAALGATVILEVPAPLKTLLRTLDGVALLLCRGEALPDFDYQCPLMSLPLAFQADLSTISNTSYLHSAHVKSAAWRLKLPENKKKRVGLAWRGNRELKNDVKRSIGFDEFNARLNLAAHEEIDFYCLQKELCPEEQASLAQAPGVHYFGSALEDFSDTAALIGWMDLVISVDTSVAHLAGAMGKEVWILLPFDPDWRWLLDRTDSPWYRSARLFRQTAMGDWAGVLEPLAAELKLHEWQRHEGPADTMLPTETAALANAAKLNVAVAMHQQGQLLEAQALYREILLSEPRQFDALQLLATIAAQKNDSAAAVLLFEQALAIEPHQARVHNNLGIALGDLKRFDEALHSYERALLIEPGYAEAHNNRGNALLKLKRPLAALESYDQALRLKPGHADAHNNRGNALRELQQPLAALCSFEQALRIKPDDAQTHNNCGLAFSALQRFAQAMDSYNAALKIEPDHVDANFNQSLCRLLTGDFSAGWAQHEWRWKTENGIRDKRVFAQAAWLGEADLNDKTILLHSEQGFGDTLQFCRYAKGVAALGARVILEVPAPLKPLLQHLDGVAVLVCRGETLPCFDYHCPLLSLPLAFQTEAATISNNIYLRSAPEKRAQWRSRVPHNNKKKVGLAWSGNPEHANDACRSISLDQFQTIVNLEHSAEHIDYYCVQKEVRAADQAMLAQTPAIRLFGNGHGDCMEDFSDTAAVLDLMDLVITVDTSVAHLAGAMGKPVWILLPFNVDWRWLLERTDSPWYGSARLFRQPASGDWASVLAQVASQLQAQLCIPLARAVHNISY